MAPGGFSENSDSVLSFLATLAIALGLISWGSALHAQTTPSTPSDTQTTPSTPTDQQTPPSAHAGYAAESADAAACSDAVAGCSAGIATDAFGSDSVNPESVGSGTGRADAGSDADS